MLIFLVGSLSGLFLGSLLCIRFIRQEVAADIGPRLRRIQGQLDTLEAEVALALSTRYAELTAQLPPEPPRQF
jgi:hypothetical protein